MRKKLHDRRSILIVAVVASAACAAAATAAHQAAAVGPGYKSAGGWGKAGTGDGQFSSNSLGIATDDAANVYVADTDNNRVQVFSAKGAFLRRWGSAGSGAGQFAGAGDVDLTPNGSVVVADEGNGRVQLFSSAGGVTGSFAATSNTIPRGIAVDVDGNVLIAENGGKLSGIRRYEQTPGGWSPTGGLQGAGPYRADDVEASPDGTLYLTTSATQGGSDDRVRRYSADGKPLGSFKRPAGYGTRGIGIDLDCNVWAAISSTEMAKYSPSGKLLATATLPYLANDIAAGPKGDLYVLIQNGGVVHLAEDRAKPASAVVVGNVAASKGVAKLKYLLSGVACPAQLSAVASLSGAVTGKAAVKVAAGKSTVISIPVKGSSGKAQFKIVLKTNGRPTTHVASVSVTVK